jgi:hypothetical protein
MKYKVKTGFMAHQFGVRPLYCIGIECNALKNAWEYECQIGKDEHTYTINYDEALTIANERGADNVMRKMGNKTVFIIPVEDMKSNKPVEENLPLI